MVNETPTVEYVKGDLVNLLLSKAEFKNSFSKVMIG